MELFLVQQRQQDEDFIAVMAANMGKTTNVTAELWAIREGLVITTKMHIKRLHIETDSQQARRSLMLDIQALLHELEDC